MDKRQLGYLAGAFVFLAALVAVSRVPRTAPDARRFTAAALSRAGGGPPARLDACGSAKCLTVYVAPWCGICRGSTKFIAAFAAYLKGAGVETRIVVGQSSPGEVSAYARDFGPDTFMDPNGEVPVSGGVPNFMVSDGAGKILRSMAGVPEVYSPPFKEEWFKEFATMLGL